MKWRMRGSREFEDESGGRTPVADMIVREEGGRSTPSERGVIDERGQHLQKK